MRGLEGHRLAGCIPDGAGLTRVSAELYFGAENERALAGLLPPDAPREAVFIAPPPSKTIDKTFGGARVVFSRSFPLSVEQFLPVAQILARTARHFSNVHRFLSSKLPPQAGFPVSFEVHVVPAVGLTARVRFVACDLVDRTSTATATSTSTGASHDSDLLEVPRDYADATDDLLEQRFFERVGLADS